MLGGRRTHEETTYSHDTRSWSLGTHRTLGCGLAALQCTHPSLYRAPHTRPSAPRRPHPERLES